MKKVLFFLVAMLVMSIGASAQTIVKGDMNDDGRVTVADITSVVDVAVGNTPMETISIANANPFEVDNSYVVGTWYRPDGTSFTLNADGTTDWGSGYTYEFMPYQGSLFVMNESGIPVYVMTIRKITPAYLLVPNTLDGSSFTFYTNSSYVVSGITLSQSSLLLNSESTAQLTATVTPPNALNANVVWSSSNTNVATVDASGLVTAVGGGTCSITATAADGSAVSATCYVIVICVSGEVNGHAYVDLGLTSGTLWATTNVGADTPFDYGDYFAWGETSGYNDGKTNFHWSTYSHCNGSYDALTKYCANSSLGNNGFTDNLTELLPGDDAAVANWGSNWRMPSYDQQTELRTQCTWTWTTLNGVKVYKVRGPNGNTLFLPAAGYRSYASLIGAGSNGYYWSRTLDTSSPYYAYNFYFNSSRVSWNSGNRYVGQSIRPVYVEPVLVTGISLSHSTLSLNGGDTQQLTATVAPANATNMGVTWTSSDTNVATVDASGLVTAVGGGTCTITSTAADGSGVSATCSVIVSLADTHAYVDLGLTSGTLWATCNVGADNPEDYGLYFAWGETVGYTQDTSDGHSFDLDTYAYCNGSSDTMTKYCFDGDWGYNGFTDNLTELLPEDDAAYVNWGSNWRTPNFDQQTELRTECTWTWSSRNGVNGFEVVGTNGNSIFMPAAGCRNMTTFSGGGTDGYYWSRSLSEDFTDYGSYIYFYSGGPDWYEFDRCNGQSVRPVRASQ